MTSQEQALPLGYVRLYSLQTSDQLIAQLGESSPQLSGGSGGWEEIARPKRSPIMDWQSRPLFRLSLQLLFDGWGENLSQQSAVDTLTRLGGVLESTGRPPVLSIDGHVRGTELDWVVESIEWDSVELRDENGVLLRASCTVALAEHVPASIFVEVKAPTAGAPKNYKRHRIKRGETLLLVSRKYAGKKASTKRVYQLASQIKSVNKIRDPQAFFKKNVGKVILIP